MTAVTHYENFPVASWLCPAPLRPGVVALYRFARTADDLADEGEATADQRLSDLARYRAALLRALGDSLDSRREERPSDAPPTRRPGHPQHSTDWSPVFAPLAQAHGRYQWPVQLLTDLLDAFEEDVRRTAVGTRYGAYADLLAYSAKSANPVGRLLLHMQGVSDAASLAQSDAICSALQLINFWQDLQQDLGRGRHYLPAEVLAAHGLRGDDPAHLTAHTPQAQAMMEALVDRARSLMQAGAPLVHRVPGRFGWELRAVVQGGLRICDRIRASEYRCWLHRPKLNRWDGLIILSRMVAMRA